MGGRILTTGVLIAWLLAAGCTVSAPATAPIRSPATPGAAVTPVSATVAPQLPVTQTTVAGASSSPTSTLPYTLALQPVLTGFDHPVSLAVADSSNNLYVLEQQGRIWQVRDNRRGETPFLDITSLVLSDASERGLLGLAFHPQYRANRRFFVDYTRIPDGATVIAEYTADVDGRSAPSDTGRVLLVIPQPERNHNGGQLQFGPDGYLYIGMGDGGGGGDQHGLSGNGQSLGTLLGKILRIDVNVPGKYTPAQGNPFLNRSDAKPEIWAYGLRNPWRFSFDRATGDLYIGDVGQGQYEEIDFQPASSAGGANYGWRIMEGMHCYQPAAGCDETGLAPPVAEYDHSSGCAVIGGYVYRGTAFPWLQGVYLYADFCSGTVWTLHRENNAWVNIKGLETHLPITAFTQDAQGDLYLVEYGGGLFRLMSAPVR